MQKSILTKHSGFPMGKRNSQKVENGIKLFRDFNDEEPQYLDDIYFPDLEKEVLVLVGPVLAIEYHARDGHNYRHEFKKKSQPNLTTTQNGLHLILIGGNYRFTDRGIVDR